MIADVDEAQFAQRVVERSHEVPVVVDFWAAWCGPCRQLTPALERAAQTREGAVDLAKVDVDANPQLAAQFGVQGIPAVKAFRDGAVADEFTGAVPPAQVEAFFDGLVPSEADRLVAEGDEASLRRAVGLEPGRADAALPLARQLIARGERDEARAILENVTGSFAAEGLAARLRLGDDHADPQLREALAELEAGRTRQGLDALIELLPERDGEREEIRRVIVGTLEELGPGDASARDYRRRLAAALY